MTHIRPRYSGPGRTGICVCGHRWDDHHLGIVLNPAYIDATGEGYFPQECEFWGCNEEGGLDDKGERHCFQYRDQGEEEEDDKSTKS